MERYDLLYRLYDEYDTKALRELQDFVDLFPPVDSRVALDHWQDASDELADRKDEIRDAFAYGGTFAEIAARADREAAFTAQDLHAKYGRSVNALVLDVDETLRSAGGTDNEIPRDTLHAMTEFHEADVPIVVCTGQTMENVKGFAVQGLGSGLVHSGSLSIVYEAGTGVFTPGHGAETKQLLYEGLGEEVRGIFDGVRTRVLPDAPEALRRSVHLQGNEFNVTLKPNFDVGSKRAADVIDRGLVYLLDLLARAVDRETGADAAGGADAADADADGSRGSSDSDGSDDPNDPNDPDDPDDPDGPDGAEGTPRPSTAALVRAYYADADPEIRAVLESEDAVPDAAAADVPDDLAALLDRIDVAYYHADAAEVGSLELNKVVGVEAALDVLGVDDPFVLAMGDSKSDLRVMRWAAEGGRGIAAAPEHASEDVLDHVVSTDELVYDRGEAADVLRTAYVLNLLSKLP
jgi:hydroxymethylpyrimidine pyrophosphatase-like HAD family hydrolase